MPDQEQLNDFLEALVAASHPSVTEQPAETEHLATPH